MHKVKPETLKSILSLVRNTDNRTSAVDGSSSSSGIRDIGGVGGDRSQQCVTSHVRDTGSDDERSPAVDDAVLDAAAESQRTHASESCEATQDEQMRLASEGE